LHLLAADGISDYLCHPKEERVGEKKCASLHSVVLPDLCFTTATPRWMDVKDVRDGDDLLADNLGEDASDTAPGEGEEFGGGGFSAFFLNFEQWSAEQVLQWVEALPAGSLSAPGRQALLAAGMTGEALAECTNRHVVSSRAVQTRAEPLEGITELTAEDVLFFCDELDAIRELRIACSSCDPQDDDDKHRNFNLEATVEESRRACWSSEWSNRFAPPIPVVTRSCLHMDSDADEADDLPTEESRCVPNASANKSRDEFDELLDEEIIRRKVKDSL
jgi:hypothetical protein